MGLSAFTCSFNPCKAIDLSPQIPTESPLGIPSWYPLPFPSLIPSLAVPACNSQPILTPLIAAVANLHIILLSVSVRRVDMRGRVERDPPRKLSFFMRSCCRGRPCSAVYFLLLASFVVVLVYATPGRDIFALITRIRDYGEGEFVSEGAAAFRVVPHMH